MNYYITIVPKKVVDALRDDKDTVITGTKYLKDIADYGVGVIPVTADLEELVTLLCSYVIAEKFESMVLLGYDEKLPEFDAGGLINNNSVLHNSSKHKLAVVKSICCDDISCMFELDNTKNFVEAVTETLPMVLATVSSVTKISKKSVTELINKLDMVIINRVYDTFCDGNICDDSINSMADAVRGIV